MNDVTIAIAIVVIIIVFTAFLLGRIQGRYKERMFLFKTVTDCNISSIHIHKGLILDELERKYIKK